MVFAETTEIRRPRKRHPLVPAVVISMIVHALVFGLYKTGERFGWQKYLASAWLKKLLVDPLTALTKPKPKEQEARPVPAEAPEPPLLFVEVDPSQATPEAPKNAKYYSALNSQAANIDIKKESAQPDIDGKQEKIIKTVDVARPQPLAAQPGPKVTPTPEEETQAAQPKPKRGDLPGDLALAQPVPLRRDTDGRADSQDGRDEAAREKRPRTVAEARQLSPAQAAERMRQEGGVSNLRLQASLDAMGTPFGAYDAALIAAIQQCWWDLLGQKLCPSGKVVLEFKMHHDGRVTDMKVVHNDVGDFFGYFCQQAVLKPVPFPRWPPDMRRMLGSDVRPVTFTFYYN